MDEPLDPTQWPRYVFHHTKDPVCVATPEAEAALGEGWRRTQYTPDEAREARKPLDRTKYPAVRTEVAPDAVEARSARRQVQLARKRERDKASAERRRVEADMMREIERKREEDRHPAVQRKRRRG